MGGALVLASISAPVTEINAGVVYYGIPPAVDATKIKVRSIASVFSTFSFCLISHSFAAAQVPVLMHFGQTDDSKGFSDPESAAKLQEKLQQSHVNSRLFMYDGVGHAFMNKDRPEVYNKEGKKRCL
jgi:carboxymethylenebutenolidase